MAPKFPAIKVRLTGMDGNAFAILGRVMSAMRAARCSAQEIKEFSAAATSGDYDHLLQTVMATVAVDEDEDVDEDEVDDDDLE